MKKLLAITSLATVATLSMSTLVFATSPQKPVVTNTATAVAPSIIVDRATLEELVPIRSLAESNGFEVKWINETKTTVLTKDGNEYSATLGSTSYNVNGRVHILETPTKAINGLTYVPKTFITLVENSLDGGFDFNNPNIDPGFSVDVKDGAKVGYNTLPAEINK